MHQYPYPLRYTCSFVGLSFPLLHTENCQIQHIYMSTQIAVSRHVTANCIILCHLHWFWRWRERTRKEKTKGWLCIGWTWGINNWRRTRGDSVRGVSIQLYNFLLELEWKRLMFLGRVSLFQCVGRAWMRMISVFLLVWRGCYWHYKWKVKQSMLESRVCVGKS